MVDFICHKAVPIKFKDCQHKEHTQAGDIDQAKASRIALRPSKGIKKKTHSTHAPTIKQVFGFSYLPSLKDTRTILLSTNCGFLKLLSSGMCAESWEFEEYRAVARAKN